MIGQTLGHFHVLSKLGAGGMGIVYEAEDTRLGRTVALKLLPPELAQDRDLLARFQREARVASTLNHPGICTVFAVEEHDSLHFIVMERLEGITLAERIEGGPLELETLADTVIQIADALRAAHAKGIVHRDLKPGNVFISPAGQTKIIDFGLAMIATPFDPNNSTLERLTASGTTFGTPAYMSPEQARGEPTDARTDLFSLGAMLYQLATAELPFAAETPALLFDAILNRDARPIRQLNPRLPAELERIVTKLLEKDRSLRYQSAADLLADLGRLKRDIEGRRTHDRHSRSVAVLYLENLSGAREDEYFRDGVTEDILTELSKIQEIKVFSRATVLAYRDRPATPAQIGQQLGAAYVLTGSFRRANTRLRINVQLVDTDSDFPLWSERYDREMKDVFDVQDEIARRIAAALRITLTPHEQQALAATPTNNPIAYDLFLRGKSHFRRRTRQDLEFALQTLETAVLLDPDFALAYAFIANVCAVMFYHYDHTPHWLERAAVANERAVMLQPELPESRTATAWMLYAAGKYGEAAAVAREGIERSADSEGAYYLLALALIAAGRAEEVRGLAETAIAAVGAEDYNIYAVLMNAFPDRNEQAVALSQKAMTALEGHLRNAPEDARAHIHLAAQYARTGRTEDALREATFATALRPNEITVLYVLACTYCWLGRNSEAMEALGKAWEGGWRDVNWMRRDPDLAPLHGTEEFERLYPAESH